MKELQFAVTPTVSSQDEVEALNFDGMTAFLDRCELLGSALVEMTSGDSRLLAISPWKRKRTLSRDRIMDLLNGTE